MILPNMNDNEIVKNFRQDMAELGPKIDGCWKRELRRVCLKRNIYPFLTVKTFKLKSGNKYCVRMVVMSKSELKKGLVGCNYSFFLPKQKCPECVAVYSDNNKDFYVEHYPAHFIQRYRERMKLDGTNEEVMKHYFKNNSLGTIRIYKKDHEGEHFTVTTEEGVGYGILAADKRRVVKTFIPHSDLCAYKTLLQAKSVKMLRELQSMGRFY